MAHYWSNFACDSRPPHFNSLASDDPLRIFQTIFTSPETRTIVLPDGENRRDRSFIRLDTIPACDGKTDRRTDRHRRRIYSRLHSKLCRCLRAVKTKNYTLCGMSAGREVAVTVVDIVVVWHMHLVHMPLHYLYGLKNLLRITRLM